MLGQGVGEQPEFLSVGVFFDASERIFTASEFAF
jgi:hypothetical protein